MFCVPSLFPLDPVPRPLLPHCSIVTTRVLLDTPSLCVSSLLPVVKQPLVASLPCYCWDCEKL